MGLPVTVTGFTRLTVAVERVADALETLTAGGTDVPDDIAAALTQATTDLATSTDSLKDAVDSNT